MNHISTNRAKSLLFRVNVVDAMGDFIFNEKRFGDARRMSGKGLHRKELVQVFIQKRV